jgi:hypothetical protein
MLARMRAGIKSATPLPRIEMQRLADAGRNCADPDVAEINVLAIGAFGIAAAGEDRHGAIQARPRRTDNGGGRPVLAHRDCRDAANAKANAAKAAIKSDHGERPWTSVERNWETGNGKPLIFRKEHQTNAFVLRYLQTSCCMFLVATTFRSTCWQQAHFKQAAPGSDRKGGHDVSSSC